MDPWFIRGSYLDQVLSIYFILVEGWLFLSRCIFTLSKILIPGEISQFYLLGMMNSRCMTTPLPSPRFFFSRKRAPNVLNHTRTYPDAGTWTSIVVVRESDLSEAGLHVSVSEALPKGLFRFNGSRGKSTASRANRRSAAG